MITLPTSDPTGLLTAIRDKIDAKSIRTWSYDADGDFTHTAEQWNDTAWLSPHVEDDRLEFFILPPRGTTLSTTTYAIFHGRFIEMALRHFDRLLSAPASASPFPMGADLVE